MANKKYKKKSKVLDLNGNTLGLYMAHESRKLFFHSEVGQYAIVDIITSLEYLQKQNNKPITLQICSPGGSVDHGLVLYDFIKASKVPIYTVCTGMAASMGAILLAAGKKGHRAVTKNARIMIHQPSSGYIGRASDIEIHAKETARIRSLLNKLISEDTGQPLKKVSKDTELDLWMTAEEAVEYGIVDRVIK